MMATLRTSPMLLLWMALLTLSCSHHKGALAFPKHAKAKAIADAPAPSEENEPGPQPEEKTVSEAIDTPIDHNKGEFDFEALEDAEFLQHFYEIRNADMSIPTETPVTDPPTKSPTPVPSLQPTTSMAPSMAPTRPGETRSPTVSAQPTSEPSAAPSSGPTGFPTPSPTATPSAAPSSVPSSSPSAGPTREPSANPSAAPSPAPSDMPSTTPSAMPSSSPTMQCNLPTAGREALLMNDIMLVSDPDELAQEGTPQNLAMEWIINLDTAYVCPQDDNVIQRFVLAVFYYSTRGDVWSTCAAPEVFDDEDAIEEANQNCDLQVPEDGSTDLPDPPKDVSAWLTPSHECDYGGIACDDDGFITRIDMEKNGVSGTLPSELRSLQSLKYLLLEEGVLTGSVPQELGDIRTLEEIDLNFNLLGGTLPENIYFLSNLRVLDLNDNELNGELSTRIGSLQKLEFFQIENNFFTGNIPTEMGLLQELEVATLDHNQLEGSMPDEVCQNDNIEVLTADCLGAPNRPSPPYVACSCCTQCF